VGKHVAYTIPNDVSNEQFRVGEIVSVIDGKVTLHYYTSSWRRGSNNLGGIKWKKWPYANSHVVAERHQLLTVFQLNQRNTIPAAARTFILKATATK
jgi:hypothetical protein